MPYFSLFSASLCLFVGLYIYFKGKDQPINRSFLIFNILIFFWNSGDFVIPLGGLSADQGVLYDRISQIGGILLAPWFIVFFMTLTGHGFKEIFKSKAVRFFSVLAVGLLGLIPTPLLIKNVEVQPFKEIPGNFLAVEIAAFAASIFFSLGFLLKARKTAAPAQKIQLTYFGAAILIGILCAVGWFIVISFFPRAPTNFIYIFEVSYVLLTAYAILRHHFMNIDVIVKKTAVYAILSTFVIGIYLIVILMVEFLFRSLTGSSMLVEKFIAAFVIALTFHPIRSRLEKVIDRAFFRGKYDVQDALSKFTRSLVAVLDQRELVNLMTSIGGILKAKNAFFLLWNDQAGRYRVLSSPDQPRTVPTDELGDSNGLVRLLTSSKKVIVRGDVERTQAMKDYPDLKTDLNNLKAEVVIPVFVKDDLCGALVLGEKLSEKPYTRDDVLLLTTLADAAGIAFENAKLYGSVKRTYYETVQALAQAIEASDEYTRGHSDRVTKIAMEIAIKLNIGRDNIDNLKFAGILHDVGKIGVIKEILHRPGKLNELEFGLIKMHPILGEDIIKPIAFLDKIRPIIRHHHERFDGRGYPDGLRGDDIPLLSRILAVADTYDAMTSHRPYRSALAPSVAIAEIKKFSGTQFDPEIVQVFLEIYKAASDSPES